MKRLCGIIGTVIMLSAVQVFAEKAGPADLDSDGKVSKEEFCQVRAKYAEKAGKPADKAASEKLFASRDKNGDGFLTGDETISK